MVVRRFWVGLTSAVLVASVAAGCGSTPQRGAAAGLEGEVVIGAVLELSGPGAVIGTVHRNALQVTVDQLNEGGVLVGGKQRRVRLVVRDSASDPAKGAAAARELITADGVAAIVGSSTTAVTMAVVPVVEELGVPLVSLAASDAIVTPVASRKYCFKVSPNGGDIAASIAEQALRMGARKIGLLTAKGAYGDIVTQVMTGSLGARAADGLSLAKGVRFAEDGSDVADRVADLLAARPEAILIGALMPGAARAVTAIHAAGYTGKVFLDPSAGADQFLTGPVAADAEGMFMVHPAVLDPNGIATTPAGLAQQEFRRRYIQAYDTYSGVAPSAYDALHMITEAITTTKGTDHKALRDALENTHYDGVAGNYAFGPDYHGGVSAGTLTTFVVRLGGWQLLY
ncbi:ABC transporter substrate-binding protein [Longispora sp. K20-0274]|uniref:ABC transporter substrate-binding protein n=1 Tax=Longispora sp. K20-0274 TaxID=3088255 RepID=UPI00399A83E3